MSSSVSSRSSPSCPPIRAMLSSTSSRSSWQLSLSRAAPRRPAPRRRRRPRRVRLLACPAVPGAASVIAAGSLLDRALDRRCPRPRRAAGPSRGAAPARARRAGPPDPPISPAIASSPLQAGSRRSAVSSGSRIEAELPAAPSRSISRARNTSAGERLQARRCAALCSSTKRSIRSRASGGTCGDSLAAASAEDEVELAPPRDLDHAREVGLAQLDRRAARAHARRRPRPGGRRAGAARRARPAPPPARRKSRRAGSSPALRRAS